MEVKEIEIKDTNNKEEKRLIIYVGDINSQGFRINKTQLYSLYSQLREIFKDN